MSDKSKILEKVRAALHSEPRLGTGFTPERLDIDAEGTLTIEGEAPSVAAKKLALERAAALPEVSGILDRLRVAPASPMADAEICEHLREAFEQEPSFAALEIAERRGDHVEAVRGAPDRPLGRLLIEVDDGVVSLNGEVPGLSSKRMAGLLAWWVPGSRDVVNGLGVEPPEEDNDGEILDALRLVLEKDPFVEATQVAATCTDAVITLRGLVGDDRQKDLIEFDAWYLFGVDRVINELQVAGA